MLSSNNKNVYYRIKVQVIRNEIVYIETVLNIHTQNKYMYIASIASNCYWVKRYCNILYLDLITDAGAKFWKNKIESNIPSFHQKYV